MEYQNSKSILKKYNVGNENVKGHYFRRIRNEVYKQWRFRKRQTHAGGEKNEKELSLILDECTEKCVLGCYQLSERIVGVKLP